MDRLTAMEVFVRVAEEESFSAAARRLGLSKAAVSKHIQALEERLQSRLLQRTTRRMQLTPEGRVYFDNCRRILNEVSVAEETLANLRSEPSGVLRLNAPMSFGHLHLAPAVADFLGLYPRLQVEMVMNDRFVDLVEEGFDMAVRIGTLQDTRLMARKLSPIRLVACASPGYLNRRGHPLDPEELAGHDCLIYALADAEQGPWRIFDPDRFTRHGNNRLKINNGDALRMAALQGLGIAILPTFLVGRDLQAGTLVTLLADHPLPETTLHALYPSHRQTSPKVRSCIDFLAERFGSRPYWDLVE
ncbi:MAG: LysR family transcriptional regulator [Magnetococcales bacterium]|nr:LysR family transcriptional regulator [Magnetococcales bacterium]